MRLLHVMRYHALAWVAPAGTPAPVVNLLSAELAKAVRSPDIRKVLADDGAGKRLEGVAPAVERHRAMLPDERAQHRIAP